MEYVEQLIKFLTTQFESEEEKENELVRLRYLSYETKEKRVLYMYMRHLQMTGIKDINLQESFKAKQKISI